MFALWHFLVAPFIQSRKEEKRKCGLQKLAQMARKYRASCNTLQGAHATISGRISHTELYVFNLVSAASRERSSELLATHACPEQPGRLRCERGHRHNPAPPRCLCLTTAQGRGSPGLQILTCIRTISSAGGNLWPAPFSLCGASPLTTGFLGLRGGSAGLLMCSGGIGR